MCQGTTPTATRLSASGLRMSTRSDAARLTISMRGGLLLLVGTAGPSRLNSIEVLMSMARTTSAGFESESTHGVDLDAFFRSLVLAEQRQVAGEERAAEGGRCGHHDGALRPV